MLSSEKVYTFSELASKQLDTQPSMTFTQSSLFAYLTNYLHRLGSLDQMRNRAKELFDMFIQPVDVTYIYLESSKETFQKCIDHEVGARGLAKILQYVPHAYGKEFVLKTEHQML